MSDKSQNVVVDERYVSDSPLASPSSIASGEKSGFTGHTAPFHEHNTEFDINEEDLELIQAHLDDNSLDEWLGILKENVEDHKDDTSIPELHLQFLVNLTKGPTNGQHEDDWEYYVRFYAFLFHEWSIYPEVRVVTRPIDEEPDEDYHSFRVYLIGCCWGWAGSVLATFFMTRYPSISLSSMALQILIVSSGRLYACLPRMSIPIWRGKRFVVNSGRPWSFKEQVLATSAMSVSDSYPYSALAIIVQANPYFYGFKGATSFGYMITFTLSSNCMGFGLAGLFRSFLVYPAQMVWYSVLPTINLSRTLTKREERESINHWRLKGTEFFWIFTVWWFGWYWVVNTGAQFLQTFEWICWIAPNNVNVNAITGAQTGLGLNPVSSFDPGIFNQFTGIFTPFEAYCNWMFGYMISFIGIVIMWYTNVRYTGYLPVNDNSLFDNMGQPFNVSRVIDPKTYKLDMDGYQNYSLPFWSAGNVLTYGTNFMIYTAMATYAILYYQKMIIFGIKGFVKGFKRGQSSLSHFKDPFCRRQTRYKEVPELWYFIILLGSIGMAIGCVEGYKFTETPVWSIFLGIGLGIIFIPLSGILQAKTTYYFETNVLIELIVGYALPGNPNASMVSKVYATNFMGQVDNWITNQKSTHYVGISPRSLFWCQMTSVVGSSFVQCGIMTWQVSGGIPDLCDPANIHRFTCQNPRVYFNASVQWGTIGPKRVFEGLYPTMKWCFLIGAVYPLPFWAGRKFLPLLANRTKYDRKSRAYWWISGEWLKHVNEIVMVSAPTNAWAPSNIMYYLGDFYICMLFQLYIRKKFPQWWRKYAYLFYAAFNNGSGWGGFIDFFATQYKHIVVADWWGNNVNGKNMDGQGTAVRLQLKPGEYFGPRKGHYPR